MDGHFRAFSFVDRITSVRPGARIQGHYTIPEGIEAFPLSLVAEAVGQLAAWAAMTANDFRYRPVAGLAGGIELLAPVRPGQRLELTAELETADTEAAAYGGSAQVDGATVIRLLNCVGPMMPTEEFDDPQALRDRYALLCGPGVAPGGFGGFPRTALNRTGGQAGQWMTATLQVPVQAAFFSDHFPRRPVFPGSLLMHANLELATALMTELRAPARGAWSVALISDVKLRTFLPPGEVLEIEVRLNELANDSACLSVSTRKGKRMVGGARVRLEPKALS